MARGPRVADLARPGWSGNREVRARRPAAKRRPCALLPGPEPGHARSARSGRLAREAARRAIARVPFAAGQARRTAGRGARRGSRRARGAQRDLGRGQPPYRGALGGGRLQPDRVHAADCRGAGRCRAGPGHRRARRRAGRGAGLPGRRDDSGLPARDRARHVAAAAAVAADEPGRTTTRSAASM